MKLVELTWKDELIYREVLMLARSRAYNPRDTAPRRLKAIGFLNSDGKMPDTVRDVVLAVAPAYGYERKLTPIVPIAIKE